VAVDPRARYEAYAEHILNQVYLGGQTPLPKLFTTPGFTEASAKAAIAIAERKVMALRFAKRIVEREIFTPLISQSGLDAEKASCRLNWGCLKDRRLVLLIHAFSFHPRALESKIKLFKVIEPH
jgi:hypothetical protein